MLIGCKLNFVLNRFEKLEIKEGGGHFLSNLSH